MALLVICQRGDHHLGVGKLTRQQCAGAAKGERPSLDPGPVEFRSENLPSAKVVLTSGAFALHDEGRSSLQVGET